ncbi:MAG: hypothetical protein QHH12_04920 [Candidatus Bathyarchaeota archaeon]|nr:hypothetical protein [Candidatus Bathyarchaeota archaeon A05DMB-3]MDH7607092.1 hypothetical protein [Candidatus Bathyarchaeota archaeon]
MSSEEKTTNVVQRNAQPFRLQLIRGQRGSYGWRIDVQAETRDELLYEVDMIDAYLRGKYLNESSRMETLQKPQTPSPNDPHSRMEKIIEAAEKAGGKDAFGREQPWGK